jgi:hypothetical protein
VEIALPRPEELPINIDYSRRLEVPQFIVVHEEPLKTNYSDTTRPRLLEYRALGNKWRGIYGFRNCRKMPTTRVFVRDYPNTRI